jgi:shikimate kinase
VQDARQEGPAQDAPQEDARQEARPDGPAQDARREARPQPPAVVLVGFMGAGKTAVGRELAGRLGLPFVDTDAVIAAAAGPIPEIFAARGERGFRALEAEAVLRELVELTEAPKVLALGGGAVLSDDVRAALRRAAHVVWLTAPAGELWARVAAEGERPLARDEHAFSALLAAREPLYREVASVVVSTSGRTPAAVADAVLAAVPARSGVGAAAPASTEGVA